MEGYSKGKQTDRAWLGRALGLLLPGLLCLALLLLPRLWEKASRTRLKAEIDRALTAAYSAEGAYPQQLAELEAYGIFIDESRYLVRYTPLGENQRPNVEVLLRGQRP